MSLLHFVAVMPQDLDTLEECGVRNVLVSYAFIDKFGNTLDDVRERFDKVFVDSGAFTAFSLGYDISEDEYYNWLKTQKGNYDIAAMLDKLHHPEETIKRYVEASKRNIDKLLPIAQPFGDDNWFKTIRMYEQINAIQKGDYVGIGGWVPVWKGRGLETVVKQLPHDYRYHGFAKVNFWLMQYNYFYSVDSSSWAAGHRFGTVMAWHTKHKTSVQIGVGRSGRGEKLTLMQMFNMHKKDAEICGLDLKKLLDGDRLHLAKAYIALYYRPRARQVGLFEKNFKN